MNSVWVIAALGVAGAIVSLVVTRIRGDRLSDLGTVSSQWIAEHRLGPGNDSRR
jgi:hypothetical protein